MFFSTGGGVQQFVRWVLYVFIALFPFILYEGYLFNGTSTRAINTVLVVEILAVVVGGAMLQARNKVSFVRSPITYALGGLLLVLFIASIGGIDFNASFWSKATRTTGLFYFIHLALFYFLFWIGFSERKYIRTFIKVFLVSTGIFGVLAVMGQEGVGWLFASKPWDGVTIGNSTFAGMYLYAGFVLSIYIVATMSGIRRWWHYLVPLVFVVNPYLINFDLFRGEKIQGLQSIIGSAQASSATVFLSLAILGAFWVGGRIRKSETRQRLLVGVSVLGMVVFGYAAYSLLTPGSAVQQVYLQQSTATRPIVWEFSKQAISDRPLFGWGVDNFDRVFQTYYDPSILELKNGGEAWLDRAHNIFIDQTVETGYVGLIAYIAVYLTIIVSLLYVLSRSKDRDDQVLAVVLLTYFVGHILELQTAFDTTITYVLVTCFAVFAAQIYTRTREQVSRRTTASVLPSYIQQIKGGVLIVGAITLFVVGTIPLMKAEGANGAIRRVGSSEKRIPIYTTLFSSPLDRGAFLWRTSNDIQRGVSLDPKVLEDARQREGIKKEIDVIVVNYENYLAEHPDDYRAILNLADIYIYQRLFDVDNLAKAHSALDQAITLVPQSPQPYWMKAVAYLYQAKFKEAREWAKKAYDLNPGIEESTRVKEYIDRSIKEFPQIDLYSFKQI